MSDLVQLIQEADVAVMEIEQARINIEAAKTAMEMAKIEYDQAKAVYDEVISRADEVGIPRAKLKKIIEERAAVLAASGILSVPLNQMKSQKPKLVKKPKVKKGKVGETVSNDAGIDEVRLDA